MTGEKIAALDLGSNTFRLMLAESTNGFWSDKHVFQHIPRLSEHLVSGGSFAPTALCRAWSALDDFAGRVKDAGASNECWPARQWRQGWPQMAVSLLNR